jgi:hypothetical protein
MGDEDDVDQVKEKDDGVMALGGGQTLKVHLPLMWVLVY